MRGKDNGGGDDIVIHHSSSFSVWSAAQTMRRCECECVVG